MEPARLALAGFFAPAPRRFPSLKSPKFSAKSRFVKNLDFRTPAPFAGRKATLPVIGYFAACLCEKCLVDGHLCRLQRINIRVGTAESYLQGLPVEHEERRNRAMTSVIYLILSLSILIISIGILLG